jgi:L-threonylcarbamoyladenylate synthase
MDQQADENSPGRITERLAATPAGLARAFALLGAGQTVAVPTETVYGLAADATDGAAVARIYAAKGRPAFNPLIVHVPDVAAAEHLVDMPEIARPLSAAFWPGPLTLVLPAKPANGIASLVSAGLTTLAVRVPVHPVMQQVLRALGKPLAAPSANASGRLSSTTAAHVLDGLDGKIAAVLDAGSCALGLESTILGFDRKRVCLLRAGAITAEAIEAVLGNKLAARDNIGISAPGQLLNHYAPTKPLRVNVINSNKNEILIGFDKVPGDISLSISGDLVEAAANLFAVLHRADASAAPAIAVAPIPDTGLGAAINDRLTRAARR